MHPSVPQSLQPIAAQLEQQDQFLSPDQSQLDCTKVAEYNQWRYAHLWQSGTIEPEELENLTQWFDYCGDPRRFELADGYCVHLLAQGAFTTLIEWADYYLGQQTDLSLLHTKALAQAGMGSPNHATATLNQIIEDAAFADLPAELKAQIHADRAALYQRQGMLFKALPSLYAAVDFSAELADEQLLVRNAAALIEQLSEQGGADEALTTLLPKLNAIRPKLWALILDQLGTKLDSQQADQGIAVLVEQHEFKPVMRYLYAKATDGEQPLLLAYIVALALKAPTPVTCPLAARLLMRDADRRKPNAPLIAAASLAAAETFEQRNPEQAKWHRDAVVQLISVARHHGIHESEVKTWVDEQQLYSEQGVVARCIDTLSAELTDPPRWFSPLLKLKATKNPDTSN